MFDHFDVRSKTDWRSHEWRRHEIDENEPKYFIFYGVYSIGRLGLNSMNQSINQSNSYLINHSQQNTTNSQKTSSLLLSEITTTITYNWF